MIGMFFAGLKQIRVWFASNCEVLQIEHHPPILCAISPPEHQHDEFLCAVVFPLHLGPEYLHYCSLSRAASVGKQQGYSRLLQKLSLKSWVSADNFKSRDFRFHALVYELGGSLVTVNWACCWASKKAVRGVAFHIRSTSWPRTELRGVPQRQRPCREMGITHLGKKELEG